MDIQLLNAELSLLCSEFAAYCKQHHLKLVTAESCTAGLLCGHLTDQPGSSAYIEGGFVTYSNSMKEKILGVSSKSLINFGAVSEQVAIEMVDGALDKAQHANIAVSVTGIAGPDGDENSNKPVGLVWIAVKSKNSQVIAHQYNFSGNREAVRLQTIIEAISLLMN